VSANATFLRYGPVRHALGLDGRTPIERVARATVAATVAGSGLLPVVIRSRGCARSEAA